MYLKNYETKSEVIAFTAYDDYAEFVREASKIEGPVMIKSEQWVINGKSLMGLFSLDMMKPKTVEYPVDAANFEQYISKFIVKES